MLLFFQIEKKYYFVLDFKYSFMLMSKSRDKEKSLDLHVITIVNLLELRRMLSAKQKDTSTTDVVLVTYTPIFKSGNIITKEMIVR